MSCSPFDLRDYFLRELAGPQQRQVEAHVRTCEPCREELDRLRITEAALRCAVDEEIPQRIAFVSDKIFEPSPWRRWLAAFWNSGPRLGFASAAMLSASLVVYAFRPAPAPAPHVGQAPVAAPHWISADEADRRIQEAVAKAVAESETRQAEKTARLVKEIEIRNEAERQKLLTIADESFDFLKRKNAHLMATRFEYPGEGGEPK
jgi:hypothetical protein